MSTKPPTKIYLKPEREKSLLRSHPWVFSGAIENSKEQLHTGSLVLVCDSKKNALAVGVYNPSSEIRVRILTWDVSEQIDQKFWLNRIRTALQMRKSVGFATESSNSYRLCHAESDRTPGLVVDVFGEWVVVQMLAVACETYRDEIVNALVEELKPKGIYLRNDADGREREGQVEKVELLYGVEPPDFVEICENNLKFLVDIKCGQKTGFYLDQASNRQAIMKYAADKDVLNAFCFSGGFSVYAAAAGAKSILNLDSSADSLELSRRNLELNGFNTESVEFCLGDAFEKLREFRDRARRFDLIVVDPPKFAHTKGQIEKAARAYKDVNLLALKLLNPGGTLFTFSCSGAISLDLFQKIIFGAAVDAKASVQILEYLHQTSDHPILLSFPEGEYLKGLVCRKN